MNDIGTIQYVGNYKEMNGIGKIQYVGKRTNKTKFYVTR